MNACKDYTLLIDEQEQRFDFEVRRAQEYHEYLLDQSNFWSPGLASLGGQDWHLVLRNEKPKRKNNDGEVAYYDVTETVSESMDEFLARVARTYR